MAILIVRRDARGTTDAAGDIVDVLPDDRTCFLPPSAPYGLVKIVGLSVEEGRTLTRSVYDASGAFVRKRAVFLRQQSIPAAVKNFFLANWFCGFGSATDQAQYGAVVTGDTVIDWATAQNWIVTK